MASPFMVALWNPVQVTIPYSLHKVSITLFTCLVCDKAKGLVEQRSIVKIMFLVTYYGCLSRLSKSPGHLNNLLM